MADNTRHHIGRRDFLGVVTLAGAATLLGVASRITHSADPVREQVEQNYQSFREQLPTLLASHKGKFALMRNRQIVEFFDTPGDAYKAGQKLFPEDRLFSIQEVTDTPVDLGFFSHALPQR